jgi:hypothetical protein
MKLFTAAAVAILLSSGMAFAQDNTTTGSTTGADTDPSNYLSGPNISRFYQDEGMTTLKTDAEFKAAWDAMTDKDRADIKQACMGNKDNRYNPLCASVQAM